MQSKKIKLEFPSSGTLEPADYPVSANDGHLLDSERAGNFEWWYFDCIDIRNNCILKIVVHLGTDPLRKRFFPTLAISIKTPEATRAIDCRYNVMDFHAEKDRCDLWLKQDCHIYSEGDDSGCYHIDIDIPGFHASLMFKQTVPAWVPPLHKIKISKGSRHSEFFWNVPQPGAIVSGSFEYEGIPCILNDAVGYHDHNYWRLISTKGLFMDEVLTRWLWGKCVAGPYTVIFAETWMGGESLKSIMVSEHDRMVYATDENITFRVIDEVLYTPLKSKYPAQISIQVRNEEFPLELVLNCEDLIEAKDLLGGVNPFIAWLIKILVARPAYYGIHSKAELETPDQKSAGFGIYEFMLFR